MLKPCNRATVATKLCCFYRYKRLFSASLINLDKVMFVIITYPVLQGSGFLTADVGMCELILVLAGRLRKLVMYYAINHFVCIYYYITFKNVKLLLLTTAIALDHKNKTTTKWVYVHTHTHTFKTIKCHFFWFGVRRVRQFLQSMQKLFKRLWCPIKLWILYFYLLLFLHPNLVCSCMALHTDGCCYCVADFSYFFA